MQVERLYLEYGQALKDGIEIDATWPEDADEHEQSDMKGSRPLWHMVKRLREANQDWAPSSNDLCAPPCLSAGCLAIILHA